MQIVKVAQAFLITLLVATLVFSQSGVAQAATTYKSGLPWNSGVFAEHSAYKAGKWATWRGGHVADNIAVFPSHDDWWQLQSPWWKQAVPPSFDPKRQDLAVAVPLWPRSNSVYNTGTDEQWRALAKEIKSVDPNAWVRLGWEMNLTAAYWAITNENKEQWAISFNRAVDQMRVVAPNLRFVFNPNRGSDQTCSIPAQNACTRDVFQKVKKRVVAYGLDSYDSFAPLVNSKAYRAHFDEYGGLRETARYAKQNGKQFALAEWGIACNGPECQWAGHSGGDNPLYIYHYMNFLYEVRANLAFETYYEISDSWIRASLRVNPIGPKAPKEYRTKVAQYAAKP
jgi:hypothetical protein